MSEVAESRWTRAQRLAPGAGRPAGSTGGTVLEGDGSLPPAGSDRARRYRVPSRRHLQLVLGMVWLIDGALQLQPYMFKPGSDGFLGPISENTMGQPNPATDLVRDALRVFVAHQIAVNTLIIVVQLAIGAGLLWHRTVRPALVVSVAWGLGVWVIGEGYGQLLFPQASMLTGAPGAALVYVLLALVLWPRRELGPEESVAAGGLVGDLGGRLLWAAVWCGTALLELEYANHAPDAISAQLASGAAGQPWLLAVVDRASAHLVNGAGLGVGALLLIAQFLVGWWALRDRTLHRAVVAGIVVSLVYWVVGQDLGSVLTGQGTDPNLGPVMVVFALALHRPRHRTEAGRSRSLDAGVWG